MTARKRQRRDAEARRERTFERITAARKRWQDRYDQAETPAARLAAAYDWQRAAAQLAAELISADLGDIYIKSAAAGMASNADDLCDKIEEML